MNRRPRITAIQHLACAWGLTAILTAGAWAANVSVELSGTGFDVAIDDVRNMAYVSIPSTNQVAYVSLSTFEVVDTITFTNSPEGIDLSHDNSSLYVALYGAGDVARVDIDARTFTTRDLSSLLGDDRTFDVIEAQPDVVFVSSNPGSNGSSKIVRWDVIANTAAVVAGNRTIRATPVFAVDAAEENLFIGSGFSPNSLYRLDITQASAPIVAEDDHGSVSGTRRIAVSPDGSVVVLSSGQIIDAVTLDPIGNVGSGTPSFGNDSNIVFMATNSQVTGYNLPLGDQYGTRSIGCTFSTAEQFRIDSSEAMWLVLAESRLCGIADEDFCGTSAPVPVATSPADGATGVATIKSLNWQTGASICAPEFDVYFGETNPPAGLIAESKPLPICNPGSLQPDTTYYWQVISRNGGGETQGPVWSFTTGGCTTPVPPPTATVTLPGMPFDLEFDATRQRIYVSIPSLNEVDIVSTQTLEILDRLQIGVGPSGLSLSPDDSILYAALYRAGGIAVLDLDSETSTQLNLTSLLGDYRTYDVIARSANDVFVSSSPGSSGFAYIVRVDPETGAAMRVASGRIIRASPTFELSPDGQFVYVGEGFSPNSVYKLNAALPEAPIIAEDDHGAVSGTDIKAVSPNGDRLVLRSGQVLRTSDLREERSLESQGRPEFGDSASIAYVATGAVVNAYDIYTGAYEGQFPLNCPGILQLKFLSSDLGWAAIGTNRLCIRAGLVAAPDAPLNASPENGAVDLPRFVSLEWTYDHACTEATFDVLLDTTNPPTTTACTNVNGFSCDVDLEVSTTYYWQVVAVNASGMTPGPVWSFTTVDCTSAPTPTDPQPTDAAINVPIDTTLNWSAEDVRSDRPFGFSQDSEVTFRKSRSRRGVTSAAVALGRDGDPCPVLYDVYFGATNPPGTLICSDLTAPECDLPQGLVEGTTYYWRVVSRTCCDEEIGPVWSFTTTGDLRFEPVILTTPSNHSRGALPSSETECVGVSDSFYLEIWGSDVGANNTGITCAFTNVALPSGCQLLEVTMSENFPYFSEWELAGTQILDVGGCGIPNAGVGVDEWALVATVKLRATACFGANDACLSAADHACSAYGRGTVAEADISFGCAGFCVAEDCVYDLDGNHTIDDDDFAVFMPCFDCTTESQCWSGDHCEAADFDCSGVVDPGDVGWFAAGYLRDCADLVSADLPPCRRCGEDFGIAAWIGDAQVEYAYRMISDKTLNRNDRALSARSGNAVELLVRDRTPGSPGVAAAYFELDVPGDSIVGVTMDDAFDRLRIDQVTQTGVRRIGGATLTPGVSSNGWQRVALVQLRAGDDASLLSHIDIVPAPNGISVFGGGVAQMIDATDTLTESIGPASR